MKKLFTCFFLILSFTIVYPQSGQALYEGLLYNMDRKEAIKEFKSNKDIYNIISFGDGVVWSLNRQNFTINNNKLKALMLTPKSALFGLSHESAKVYLINSFNFFISRGYEVIKEPEYWDVPVMFSPNNKFGLLMHDPEKTIVIELRSVEVSPNNYTVNLGINNYGVYMMYLDNLKKHNEIQQNNTGF